MASCSVSPLELFELEEGEISSSQRKAEVPALGMRVGAGSGKQQIPHD